MRNVRTGHQVVVSASGRRALEDAGTDVHDDRLACGVDALDLVESGVALAASLEADEQDVLAEDLDVGEAELDHQVDRLGVIGHRSRNRHPEDDDDGKDDEGNHRGASAA